MGQINVGGMSKGVDVWGVDSYGIDVQGEMSWGNVQEQDVFKPNKLMIKSLEYSEKISYSKFQNFVSQIVCY